MLSVAVRAYSFLATARHDRLLPAYRTEAVPRVPIDLCPSLRDDTGVRAANKALGGSAILESQGVNTFQFPSHTIEV